MVKMIQLRKQKGWTELGIRLHLRITFRLPRAAVGSHEAPTRPMSEVTRACDINHKAIHMNL